MKIIIKEKKGELTTQQIVMLIILITSFAVILFFFFRLNLGETTNKEICHNSVVLKGKSVAGFGNLDCRTNYLCISGGGECEGINPTETIKIDLSKDNAKNEIMETIVNEMADCWWMFGEGKVDYVGGTDYLNYHCGVCSNVKFDKAIQKNFQEISYNEFYTFLSNSKKDNSQTYLKYLYESNSIEEVKSKLKKFEFSESFSTNEGFVIITGINREIKTNIKLSGKPLPLYPYFIKSDEIKEKTECEVFDITKA